MKMKIKNLQLNTIDNRIVVCGVHYECVLEKDDKTASISGRVPVQYDADNFIEYNALTEDKVIQWVNESLGSGQVQNISDELNLRIANEKIEKPLPWLSEEESEEEESD